MSQDSRDAEFQSLVSLHFRFLTTDHNFTQQDTKVRDTSSTKDASVSITFDRSDLRVTIGLGLFDAGLGVTIRDNNWLKKPAPPRGKRRVKAVYFEYLVEFLTDGGSQPLVPHYGDGPEEQFDAVRQQVADSLGLVIERLAKKLQSFSGQVLDRDVTAKFIEADEFYRQKLQG